MECESCGFRFPLEVLSAKELKHHYDAEYSEMRFLQGQISIARPVTPAMLWNYQHTRERMQEKNLALTFFRASQKSIVSMI